MGFLLELRAEADWLQRVVVVGHAFGDGTSDGDGDETGEKTEEEYEAHYLVRL